MADSRAELQRLKAVLQAGRHAEAKPALIALARREPGNLEAAFLLGIAHVASGSPAEAIPILQRVCKAAPHVPDAHNNLGVALRDAGHPAEAVASFERALAANPAYADAHANLAHLHLREGRAEAAATHFLQALQRDPAYVEALLGLGDSLRELGRLAEARQAYAAFTQARPKHADGWNSLGVTAQALGDAAEAERAFRACLAAKPSHASALANLSSICIQKSDTNEALALAEAARAAAPDSADAANSLGNALMRLNRHADAAAAFSAALAAHPDHPDLIHNLANAHHALGRTPEAIAALERLLDSKPDFVGARFNLACMRLTMGDFTRGWDDYEARPTRKLFATNLPEWDGVAPLGGKTVLVRAEQGLGDSIQFARCLPLLAARGARVRFEVQPELVPVLGPLAPDVSILARGETTPEADLSVPLLSLPRLLGLNGISPPPPAAIFVSDNRIQEWRFRLRSAGARRIGLVWAGNPRHTNDHNRSLPLARLLAAIPGKKALFSLQKVVPESDRAALAAAPSVTALGDDLRDFADTAAVLSDLDLLITVDTSVAHLSASLGRPTWILLPTPPDWRWLTARNDSPWYPSVRLFRQHSPGDWGGALAALHAALKEPHA